MEGNTIVQFVVPIELQLQFDMHQFASKTWKYQQQKTELHVTVAYMSWKEKSVRHPKMQLGAPRHMPISDLTSLSASKRLLFVKTRVNAWTGAGLGVEINSK